MATRLPDGSVVLQVPGKRAYPVRTGPGSKVRVPAVTVGKGSGGNAGKRIGITTNQPGRRAVSKDAYR